MAREQREQRAPAAVARKAPTVRRVASGILAFLILFYIGYQIWAANYESLKFETATWATAADSFQTTGYAIRKETVITQDVEDGVVGYRLQDGSRVSKDGVVADIYGSEDAASANQQAELLSGEMERLESLDSSGDTHAADIRQIDNRIDQSINALMMAVQNHNTEDMTSAREELTYQMNQRQIATGVNIDIATRMRELKNQKAALEEQASDVRGQIVSPVSGYFSSIVDGWSAVFDYDDALNLTVEDLEKEYEPQKVAENAVGKVSEEFVWYFACVTDATTALKIKDAGSVELSMPFATTEKIPATVAAVNQASPEDDAAVILACDTMNSALSNIRKETVQIEIKNYTGVMVNQKAIHFADVEQTVTDANNQEQTVLHKNVEGVYVKSGGTLHFVQVFSTITVNGYTICSIDLTEEEKQLLVTDRTIQLYDEVVVEGKDLYDGKVI